MLIILSQRNHASIDDDITPCKIRLNKSEEEDDDNDWVDSKGQGYESAETDKLSFLKKNGKVAIIAMRMVDGSTVEIPRAITETRCKEGWFENANKSCFKVL